MVRTDYIPLSTTQEGNLLGGFGSVVTGESDGLQSLIDIGCTNVCPNNCECPKPVTTSTKAPVTTTTKKPIAINVMCPSF